VQEQKSKIGGKKSAKNGNKNGKLSKDESNKDEA
jgi:hypothetical protein